MPNQPAATALLAEGEPGIMVMDRAAVPKAPTVYIFHGTFSSSYISLTMAMMVKKATKIITPP